MTWLGLGLSWATTVLALGSVTPVPPGPLATNETVDVWGEVVLWTCDPNDATDAGCQRSFATTTFATVAASVARLDVASFDPGPSFFVEATLKTTAASGCVRLHDATANQAVGGSEVCTNSLAWVRVRSAAFTLAANADLDWQGRVTAAPATATVAMVKLLYVQADPERTVTVVRLSAADATTSTTFAEPARANRWMFEGNGVEAASFEVVATVGGLPAPGAQVRLVDRVLGIVVGTVNVPNIQTSPAVQRIIVNVVPGTEYGVDFRAATLGTLQLHAARVILVQSEATHVVRAFELALPASKTSPAFTPAGVTSLAPVDADAASASLRFEATLRCAGAKAADARLVDAGTGVPVPDALGSTAAGTPTRVRTGALNVADPMIGYGVEARARDGGATEIRNAWVLVDVMLS